MQHIRRATVFFVLSLLAAFLMSACGGGGGGEAAPDLSPSVTTIPASSETSNGAQLNGTVNPKGLSTTAWFEYSKDSTLSTNVSTTTPQALGSGSTDNVITQTLDGLESGQTYYFRVTATSSAGTKKGAIFAFNTLPLPTVVTNPATSLTTAGATLNADVNPNGRATNAWFEYGLTTAFGSRTDNQAVGSGSTNVQISAPLSGLNPATTYYFRGMANNSAGTSTGTTLSFNTAGGLPSATTLSATSVTSDGATLNGNVNPSGLPTYAWFEYGTTPSLGTAIDNQSRGSGTDNVVVNTPLSSLDLGTQYYYRIVASNSIGKTNGEVFNFTTVNPPPTAEAGVNQTVYMAGPFGDPGFLGKTNVTLSGSGSVDPRKTITSYLWEQILGTAVTFDDPTATNPSFGAPAVAYGTFEDLQFRLTVTDNSGVTGSDNVVVAVVWGFLDDFSADSTGTYTTAQTLGSSATFNHDAAGERGRVTTGAGEGIFFSKNLKIVLPGPDTQLYTNSGVFSLVFYPSSQFGSGGRIKIRLLDSANTYYEFSTADNWLRKVFGGVQVDNAVFANSYSQGGTYPITITFTPTLTTVQAFGGTASISTDGNNLNVNYFEIEVDEQNAYFDDIKLVSIP